MSWSRVGVVTHFFGKVKVAVVELDGDLELGDTILFVRNDEDLFEQEVTSMQIDRQPIEFARRGDDIGLQVAYKVRPGTAIYKFQKKKGLFRRVFGG